MQEDFVRYIKRIAILIPGLAISYVAVSDIYPLVDRRIPATLAVFIVYILVAYGMIPAFFRLIRLVYRAKHIPLYSTTPDGLASDPVNIGVVCTENQLISAMQSAGWHMADKRTARNLFKMGMSILFKRVYLTAPFSSLYLFGRKQDHGFQQPLPANPRQRHHVRFWASSHPLTKGHHKEHATFWQRYHKPDTTKRQLWIGAASLDTGIGIVRHTGQFTHMVHHDTNSERELIVRQLLDTGMVNSTRTIKVGEPYKLLNRAQALTSGYFHADGKMTICELVPENEKNGSMNDLKQSKSLSRRKKQKTEKQ